MHISEPVCILFTLRGLEKIQHQPKIMQPILMF